MMKRSAVHHGYPEGATASGFIGAGGTARFSWTGQVGRPEGRTDAAVFAGSLTDHELRTRMHPDLNTILRLGGHWAAHQQHTIEDD